MLVSVKQEHIDKGGKTPCDCPIALAAKDLPEFAGKEIAVYSGSFRVGYLDLFERFIPECRYNLDILVTAWIMKYDRGAVVSPFSFDLDTTKDYARQE